MQRLIPELLSIIKIYEIASERADIMREQKSRLFFVAILKGLSSYYELQLIWLACNRRVLNILQFFTGNLISISHALIEI